jgi:hypothetical protein
LSENQELPTSTNKIFLILKTAKRYAGQRIHVVERR